MYLDSKLDKDEHCLIQILYKCIHMMKTNSREMARKKNISPRLDRHVSLIFTSNMVHVHLIFCAPNESMTLLLTEPVRPLSLVLGATFNSRSNSCNDLWTAFRLHRSSWIARIVSWLSQKYGWTYVAPMLDRLSCWLLKDTFLWKLFIKLWEHCDIIEVIFLRHCKVGNCRP